MKLNTAVRTAHIVRQGQIDRRDVHIRLRGLWQCYGDWIKIFALGIFVAGLYFYVA